MQVARVISRVSSRESWTVLGGDDAPVAPVERYLAYLSVSNAHRTRSRRMRTI